MPACVEPKDAKVVGQNACCFRSQQSSTMGLCIFDPACSGLPSLWLARVFIQKHNGMCVVIYARRDGLGRFLEIRHDDVDPGGQCFGLARLQVVCKVSDVRVLVRLIKQRSFGQLTDPGY